VSASPLLRFLTPPVRIWDSRVNGVAGSGPLTSGQTECFSPDTRNHDLPPLTEAVVVNVVAIPHGTRGWLTVYPQQPNLPPTSTLDFDPNQYAAANGVVVRLGGDAGAICVRADTVNGAPGNVDVVMDLLGFVPTGSAITPLSTPQRAGDTRLAGGPIATGTSRCLQVAGQGGIPADAAAVLLTVTAVDYATRGWLTLYPNGSPVPPTSTLDFGGLPFAVANGALTHVGTAGQVCMNVGTINGAPGSVDVALDVTGYVTGAGAAQLPTLGSPQRLVDTRRSGGPMTTGATRCFAVAGQADVPNNAVGVVINATAVDAGARGWLTIYPAEQPAPATSTLDFDPSTFAVANQTIVPLGATGQVCVQVGTVGAVPATTNVVLDIVGYLLT
jgi:hypothetical protein